MESRYLAGASHWTEADQGARSHLQPADNLTHQASGQTETDQPFFAAAADPSADPLAPLPELQPLHHGRQVHNPTLPRPPPPWQARPQTGSAPSLPDILHRPTGQNLHPLMPWVRATTAVLGSSVQMFATLTGHLLPPDQPEHVRRDLATLAADTRAALEVSVQAILGLQSAPTPQPYRTVPHFLPPPPPTLAPGITQPPAAQQEADANTRRLQRALVQALRYRIGPGDQEGGLTLQQVRALLPRHSRTPRPTDEQIIAAISISEGRLWTTPQHCVDMADLRVHCAPKDRDPRKSDAAGIYSHSVPPPSEDGSSNRHASASAHRHTPKATAKMPQPPISARAAQPKWQPRPPQPQQALREQEASSTSRSATPPRKTRRSSAATSTSPGASEYPKLSSGDMQQLAKLYHRLQCKGEHTQTRKKKKTKSTEHYSGVSEDHHRCAARTAKKRKTRSAD